MTPPLWQKANAQNSEASDAMSIESRSVTPDFDTTGTDDGGDADKPADVGNDVNSERLLFFGAPKSLQMVTVAMKLKDTCSLEEKLWQHI